MHTIEIAEKNKLIKLPDQWDECTANQLQFILRKAFDVISGQIDLDAFRVMMFAELTGLQLDAKYYAMRRLSPARYGDINALVYQLAEQLCAWPFKNASEDEAAMELNIDTVKNLLPIIQSGGNTFHGPADLLADLTFSEFRAALREMDAHIAYARDPDSVSDAMDSLNRFMGILYRPSSASHDKRMPFDPDAIHTYAHLTKTIPLWQKQTTLLWFAYCIKFIQTEDINIDGQPVNLSVLFPKPGGTGTGKKGIGWAGLLYDIAEKGVFGDAEKTDRVGLFDILIYLYKNHLDNKELERKLKRKKS